MDWVIWAHKGSNVSSITCFSLFALLLCKMNLRVSGNSLILPRNCANDSINFGFLSRGMKPILTPTQQGCWERIKPVQIHEHYLLWGPNTGLNLRVQRIILIILTKLPEGKDRNNLFQVFPPRLYDSVNSIPFKCLYIPTMHLGSWRLRFPAQQDSNESVFPRIESRYYGPLAFSQNLLSSLKTPASPGRKSKEIMSAKIVPNVQLHLLLPPTSVSGWEQIWPKEHVWIATLGFLGRESGGRWASYWWSAHYLLLFFPGHHHRLHPGDPWCHHGDHLPGCRNQRAWLHGQPHCGQTRWGFRCHQMGKVGWVHVVVTRRPNCELKEVI